MEYKSLTLEKIIAMFIIEFQNSESFGSLLFAKFMFRE